MALPGLPAWWRSLISLSDSMALPGLPARWRSRISLSDLRALPELPASAHSRISLSDLRALPRLPASVRSRISLSDSLWVLLGLPAWEHSVILLHLIHLVLEHHADAQTIPVFFSILLQIQVHSLLYQNMEMYP